MVDRRPPLLVFRLHEFMEDANWNGRRRLPLPEGCAAIALSGGMPDIRERRKGKRDEGILTPFLGPAPNWVLPRAIWSLLGTEGRFYPTFRTAARGLLKIGFDHPVLHETKWDVLVSLKLQSLSEAERLPWSRDFLTPFSDAIGIGFGGDRLKLEKRLQRADTFAPYRFVAKSRPEPTQSRLEDAQPYLHANWQAEGFEWILHNAQLVVRPWGWEGEDAILLSREMSHDQMVSSVRRDLASEFMIHEYDGDDLYWRWATWRPDNPQEHDTFAEIPCESS